MLCSLSVKARKGQGPPGILGSSQVSLGLHINDLQQYKETLEQSFLSLLLPVFPKAKAASDTPHMSQVGPVATTAARRRWGGYCPLTQCLNIFQRSMQCVKEWVLSRISYLEKENPISPWLNH